MLNNLNALELALLTSIAEAHEKDFSFIAKHIPFLKVDSRHNTIVGEYIHFSYIEEGVSLINKNDGSCLLGTGQTIELEKLEWGMSFALNIENGKILMIEIVTNGDEVWDGNFDNFKLVDF